MELLSPAGTVEAVKAAIAGGADAIYLGYGDFNARRNAKNFSKEELITAVKDCHLRGVKVYLTMNTLLTDRELEQAAEIGAFASAIGVDAVLVQDIGLAKLLRETVADLPLHASTQMSIYNADGADFCRAIGMTRVVLARELPKTEIATICKRPIEVEVFVHGALCMCYSGQCFLSSVIGGRSGNRGMCAQPCRLSYNGGAPLSLCDLSLVQYLNELRDMGVACIKIEGRMKRAEYVAVETKIYAEARKRPPSKEDLADLELAFSRGFTHGYFTDEKGKTMFGSRKQAGDPKALFAEVRADYLNQEHRTIGIDIFAELCENKPIYVIATDEDGYCASAVGEIPKVAVQREISRTQVETQLRKTGGTVFTCRSIEIELDPGLSVPLSQLNALRREVLTALEVQRTAVPTRRSMAFHGNIKSKQNSQEAACITVSLTRVGQLSETLCKAAAVIYLPSEIYADHATKMKQWIAAFPETEFAVSLPRIAWDREFSTLGRELRIAKDCGAISALVGNWGLLHIAKQYGFRLRGDYGLEFFNSLTGRELERFGFVSATASFELKFAQIRDLEKPIQTEAIVYGRLPLMISENPIETLRDRLGEIFPARTVWGGRSELLNSKTLFLADKKQDYETIGLWGARFLFSEETAEDCIKVLEEYKQGTKRAQFTRGLYYRDVE
ncbi:MAG: U32 family peptidase [Evtepia sp.]